MITVKFKEGDCDITLNNIVIGFILKMSEILEKL